METKKCPRCEEIKNIDRFKLDVDHRISPARRRRRRICRKCTYKAGEPGRIRYLIKNRDKVNKRRREKYLLDRERIIKQKKLYRSRNPEKVKSWRKKEKLPEYRLKANRKEREKRKNDPIWRAKKDKQGRETHAFHCKNLTDSYLKKLLLIDKTFDLKRGDITPELIALKRKQLSLARSLKLKKI